MERPQFRCPENDQLARISDPTLLDPTSAGQKFYQSPSYALAVDFMYMRTRGDGPNNPIGSEGETYALTTHNVPEGYTPKITKIGDGSQKVFMGCSAKYSNPATPPQFNFSYKTDYGGSFGDRGPWITAGSAWAREMAPGNGGTGFDSRMYGFRHGKRIPFGAPDTFRFTVAFYDGHVGTFGDLEGSNPAMWNPKGTQVAYSRMYKDVKQRFYNTTTSSGSIIVP
jgi:prepilin-type processing-associated H-X9-DG protein